MQVQQIRRHCPKGPYLFVALSGRAWSNQTSNQGLLVNINAAAALVDQFHLNLLMHKLVGSPRGCEAAKSLLSVLGPGDGSWPSDRPWCLVASQIRLFFGLTAPELLRSSTMDSRSYSTSFHARWRAAGSWLALLKTAVFIQGGVALT
jgi:hypothetical protein